MRHLVFFFNVLCNSIKNLFGIIFVYDSGFICVFENELSKKNYFLLIMVTHFYKKSEILSKNHINTFKNNF